jgi:beta-lactamase class D
MLATARYTDWHFYRSNNKIHRIMNYKKIVIFSFLLFVFSFNSFAKKDETRPEFKKFFDEYNLDGAFVLYDKNNKKFIRYNPERAKERFIPASTFKIANSLIGLETGVIAGEEHIFKWNGKKHSIEAWNRDLNLPEAFNASCVPCYQELARKIGEERMQKWVKKLGYGNKDISGGIDLFWLTGDLRISPDEEVKFLRRLYENKLPVKQRTMDIVKKIMLRENTPEYKFSYKTGWQTDNLSNASGAKSLGWLVGYVEQNNNVYFFATNLETENTGASFAASRMEITRKILKELNLL